MKQKARTMPCIFCKEPLDERTDKNQSHISFAMTAELSYLCGASLAAACWMKLRETTCLNRRPDRARRSLTLKRHQ